VHEAAANAQIVILQVKYYESCVTKETLPVSKSNGFAPSRDHKYAISELPFTCVDLNESPCKTIHMNHVYFHANQTHFHRKVLHADSF